MQITIHRGIDQIGGCITEITTSSTRIFIDLGQNLPDNEGNINDPLATREAIAKLTDGVDAILYTHYHGDHVGLFNYVPKDIPQYIGKVAKEVCICKYTRLGFIKERKELSAEEVATLESMNPIVGGRSFKVKDIKITPYFVSHSAYESFMFLIEAEGKRILHTGDFREHSYLGKGLDSVLDKVGEVDVLITEGTMLSRADAPRHEYELQRDFARLMKQYKNLFVISSSTDLERLATIRAAHKESLPKTPFVTDDFQKQILTIFTDNLKSESPLWDFETVYDYRENNEKLIKWMNNEGFTMLVRCTDKYQDWLDNLLPQLDQNETAVVFSMWGEYINKGGKHAIKSYCDMVARFKNVERIHTSGHASAESLVTLCEMTSPRLAIIPIHSERSSNFLNLPISEVLKSRVVTKSTFVNSLEIII